MEKRMPRTGTLLTIVFAVVTAVSGIASAADVLETIVKKTKLDRSDRAKIETEVAVRVKKFMDAADKPRRRRNARDSLIATSKVSGATAAGLDAYAEACADELTSPLLHKDLAPALDAVNILVSIGNQNTAEALARGLSSEHVAVRYAAAAGIQPLHKALAKRRKACRNVLRALGRACTTERHELVLRESYRALNFNADVANFGLTDEAAGTLVRIFSGRLDQLSSGSRDEWKDTEGYVAAADCYAGASPALQKALIRQMVDFLALHVDRYLDDDIATAYLPTLRKTVQSLEKSLHAMMRVSKVDSPTKTVGAAIRRKPGSRSTREARAALADLDALLKRPPWNLP